VTLDPIIKTDSASQTQTATLDSSPSQNISFTTSTSVAIEQNSGIVNSGIVRSLPISRYLSSFSLSLLLAHPLLLPFAFG